MGVKKEGERIYWTWIREWKGLQSALSDNLNSCVHDNRGVSEGVTKSKHLPDYTYRNNKEFITIEELATPGD